tara:strand:+ start:165 stop:806 length:642 start_codon:yes stop_codon:yes gene_type:complete
MKTITKELEVKQYNNFCPYIVIDNFYNENELGLIWQELEFLCNDCKLTLPDDSDSATSPSGEILKNNKCIYVDDVYKDRKFSNILVANRKLFDNWGAFVNSHSDWFFNSLICNVDLTLISYYENGGYYKPHRDKAVATSLTWLYKEPKKFVGGDLTISFKDEQERIEVKNNRMVIIPSFIEHEVIEIRMDKEDCGNHLGRFCMTQFIHYDPHR